MYSWQMRQSGSSWKRINNAKSPSYTTDTNLIIGQYDYKCVVANGAGSVMSRIATVMVYGEYYVRKSTNYYSNSHIRTTFQEDHT